MVRSVFRPSRIRDGKRVRSRVYWGQYRFNPDDRISRVSLKTTDKRVAEKRLDGIIREIEQERVGLIAPRSVREASARSLSEHLDDLLADLAARGRSDGYIRKIRSRIGTLIEACGWNRVADVTPDSFITWRSAADLSPRTLNHYLDAAQVLMGWLVSTNRIPENPLRGVQKVQTRGRETFERRAFTDGEVERLLSVCGDRWPVYLVAVQTGLRLNELRSLRWGDVALRGEDAAPFIALRAMTTKNRRADVIPLSDDAASALRHLAEDDPKDQSAPVFAGGMPSHHTVNADLERAGIEKVDELGRRVDFHALRKTFITNLQRAGVERRVAMALARHSDSRMTDSVYTDVQALPLAAALDRLPRLGFPRADTNDAQDAQRDAQEMRPDGHGVAQVGTPDTHQRDAQATDPAVSCSEDGGHGGTSRVTLQKWSRGESNPRAGIVSRAPLRA